MTKKPRPNTQPAQTQPNGNTAPELPPLAMVEDRSPEQLQADGDAPETDPAPGVDNAEAKTVATAVMPGAHGSPIATSTATRHSGGIIERAVWVEDTWHGRLLRLAQQGNTTPERLLEELIKRRWVEQKMAPGPRVG